MAEETGTERMSDRMREVTLKVKHNGQPECRVSERYPSVTMRSVSSMTGRTTERKRIIEVSGDPETVPKFIDDFRDGDPIVAAEPVTPLGEPTVFVALTFNAREWDSIAEQFAELGVHYRTGTVITGGWERWTLYLEEGDDLSTIIEALESRGNDVRLVRQVDTRELEPSSRFEQVGALHDLTQRQREALATAIRAGYYGHEKDAGVEDVADELGVGTTTAWEHLARAEGKVMDDLGEFLDAGPQ
ncbi:helix-turn-helix domain-containing protein [Halobaculum gomorrense]|uniref:Predicted DNA binding protein, contains HTH domain n=1 Tax=Halobaculum gomorrense TaxID=43928 RepID=A0A1M5M5X9_9EURY|nr:helix-turn-helix domain-containing protein [Halobaculum gomorrense]SHG72133.1 Predicted DNA binding protein, contains HTH domain [Halobaculum gomorrense]